MRFDELPQNDQKALQYHIECVKKEAKNNEIDICVYEDPTLYIIYIDDKIFNAIESKINGILENGLKKHPKISKLILCSPKSFMVSYEEKIELEASSTIKTNNYEFETNSKISNLSLGEKIIKYENKKVKVDKIKPELQEENFYNSKSADYDLNKEYIKKREKDEQSAA